MRRTAWLSIAVISALLIALHAEERPRYGGTLRVQLRESVLSIDPGDGKEISSARVRLATLIFDRLTQIDEKGRVRPQLAISWTSDAQHKNWRFTLRNGVTFHDGTPLTAAHVISAFTNDARWQVRAGNGPQVLVFECPNAIYDLPAVLAGVKYSIVLRGAESAQGTGPFRVSGIQPGRQISLAANIDYFEGRPYVDGIEIQMGNSIREQLIDRRLDRDDLLEVDIDQARGLSAASQRVETSQPTRLLAMMFRSENAALRELLARSIDREAIHSVILKKSGAPANSLLPQWLTGYAQLFRPEADPMRVQKLKTDLARTPPIYLAFDPTDPVSKAVADRIAVNARDVGLTVQAFGEKATAIAAGQTRADAVLVSIPLGSSHASQALAQLAEGAGLDQADALSSAKPEQLYAAEDAMLETNRIIPIAHLPATFWTSSRVRNWKMLPDGRWKLEQVWLDSVK
ncbi:MAG TPA: ABC transporter substrate-binding protein [Terriglobales bacterium]|nr:ABC transporter substrate-binding protein [Terriglobales bacterium]